MLKFCLNDLVLELNKFLINFYLVNIWGKKVNENNSIKKIKTKETLVYSTIFNIFFLQVYLHRYIQFYKVKVLMTQKVHSLFTKWKNKT